MTDNRTASEVAFDEEEIEAALQSPEATRIVIAMKNLRIRKLQERFAGAFFNGFLAGAAVTLAALLAARSAGWW